MAGGGELRYAGMQYGADTTSRQAGAPVEHPRLEDLALGEHQICQNWSIEPERDRRLLFNARVLWQCPQTSCGK